MPTSKISIVIPTVGRESLTALLRSIAVFGGGLIADVAVVYDPAKTAIDRVRALVPEFGTLAVRVLRSSGVGANRARNAGARLAESSTLLFLDDDVAVTGSDFFIGIVEAFSNPEVIAAGGDYGSAPQADWATRGYNALCSMWRSSAGTLQHEMLLGGCLAVRKKAWEEIGGFNEAIAFGGTETEFICRLRSSAGLIVSGAKLRVQHGADRRSFAMWLSVAYAQGRNRGRSWEQLPRIQERVCRAGSAFLALSRACKLAFAAFAPAFLFVSAMGSIAQRFQQLGSVRRAQRKMLAEHFEIEPWGA